MDIITLRFDELLELIPKFKSNSKESIVATAMSIAKAFESGRKILICGNGGSAADSQHFAAELVSAFSRELSRPPISAMSLTVDTSIITAFSNDFNFENVFARQVDAHGKNGDVLIAITTSGSSKNCIYAARAAQALGMKVISLTQAEAEISKFSDQSIQVPSNNTQHIQECHIIAYHIMSELIENSLFGEES